ncbi:MAG: amidohydrolase family protein [Solirubrobacteraceae bacterium]
MALEETFGPWLDALRAGAGGFELFDAHTHIGRHDPDGFKQTPAELVAGLDACGSRALVFPMNEPDGYGDGVANDEALAAAHEHPDRLFAFCRVDPNAGDAAVAEARRCLDAGARGIKLHPRAQRFTMSHPLVRELVVLAHERALPVLVHAGRDIPALGADTVRLSAEFPAASLILAHAAISDLAWLWRELPAHPNLYVDTAWWNPVDVVALFTLAPPGQVLWASDSPYGLPTVAAVQGLRCAVQAGLTPEGLRGAAGGQLARLVAGEAPLDLGPAPRSPRALDPLLERVVSYLATTIGRAFAGADYAETLALARLACAVGDDAETGAVCAAVLELLDLFEEHLAPPVDDRPLPEAGRFLISAMYVARTPAAALPE